MKNLFTYCLMAFAMIFASTAFAGGGGAQGESYRKVIYVSSVGSNSNGGSSYDAAKPCQMGTNALAAGGTTVTLASIPANVSIRNAYMVIDTAVTSATAIDIGDDDSSNGYLPTASLTLGTPGLYGDADDKEGSYLQAVVNTASFSRKAKFYSASGKSVIMTITHGGCGAGKFRVFVEGVNIGLKPTI